MTRTAWVMLALALAGSRALCAEGPVWFWFEDCGDSHMEFEVRQDGKVVYESDVEVCRRDRGEAGHERHGPVTVKLTMSQNLSWDDRVEGLRSKAGAEMDLDLWLAGSESDGLTIGVSLADEEYIYVAEAGSPAR
jgi:hypothetical protein